MTGVDTSKWVEHPHSHDILFCQGGHTLRQGNLDFLHSLEPYLDSYISADAEEKHRIRDIVIQCSRAKGCQFLELDRESGLWKEISIQETLHKKVTTAIYDHRKRLEHRQERQDSNCDTDSFLGQHKRRKMEGESSFLLISAQWE